jgi:hypothetical protein
MLAAKKLSLRLFEQAAREDTKVGSAPYVSMMRSLKQSSSARLVTPGELSDTHTHITFGGMEASISRERLDKVESSVLTATTPMLRASQRMGVRLVPIFVTTLAKIISSKSIAMHSSSIIQWRMLKFSSDIESRF